MKEPDFSLGGRAREEILEARGGIEPPVKVWQTYALPLGDRATEARGNRRQRKFPLGYFLLMPGPLVDELSARRQQPQFARRQPSD